MQDKTIVMKPKRFLYFMLAALCLTNPLSADTLNVFIGTGGKGADGIYQCTLDTKTGALTQPALAAELSSPGFLAFGPEKKRLYSIGRIGKDDVVAAFDVEGGKLNKINHQPIGDNGSAHIAVHPSGKFLLTAQYGGGSVAVFPIADDGSVGKRSQLIKHEGGSKVVAGRQNAPHPHWVGFSPDQRYAFVPDLGLDAIVIYKVTDEGTLEAHSKAMSEPGGGPRHMRFSIDGKFIYLLNELSLSVTTFAYSKDKGTTTKLGTTPTLSEEIKAAEKFNSCSEIVVHPNGSFLYCGNRGNDTITVMKANAASGATEVVEVEPIRGSWPRNINIAPDGKWLVAAGAHSNTLSVFSVDEESGELTYQPKSIQNVPSPICILFSE